MAENNQAKNLRPTDKKLNPVLRLAILGMISALSIVLVMTITFPIFPTAPFLKMDFADTPLLLCAVLFGPLSSLGVLFVVSVIQAFLMGGDGYWGCIMHFVASGAMLVVTGLLTRKNKSTGRLILALALGALTMTVMMIPMNYIITPLYSMGGYSKEGFALISSMMLPAIIPFNIIKSTVNCAIAFVLFKALKALFVKLGLVEA